MYTFKFYYADNTFLTFEHIIKVKYGSASTAVEVPENEILSHKFPISYDLHLFSEKASHAVSSKNLKTISITKENPR
ncbi:MAG: hypothetical protein HPY66_1723 [Firmicutes bacterium]|nr:hypothetical protein [Bacillota bacterium]